MVVSPGMSSEKCWFPVESAEARAGQGSHSDWKPGKMGRHFPVREKSGNFEQTGKVREIHTKYWKTQGI